MLHVQQMAATSPRPMTAATTGGFKESPPPATGRLRPSSATTFRQRALARSDSSRSMAATSPRRAQTAGTVTAGEKALQGYAKRDLLASHTRRLHTLSKIDQSVQEELNAAVEAMEQREQAQARAEEEELNDTTWEENVDSGGFLFYRMETEAEAEMHQVWLSKRKNELARQRNADEVKSAVQTWEIRRDRLEAEIARKIEAKRAQRGVAMPVLANPRDAFTPVAAWSMEAEAVMRTASSAEMMQRRAVTPIVPPTKQHDSEDDEDVPETQRSPPRAATAVATVDRDSVRAAVMKALPPGRPTSASRRRLATPVAIPSQPPLRYANNRDGVSYGISRSNGPALERFGPPEGPPPVAPAAKAEPAVAAVPTSKPGAKGAKKGPAPPPLPVAAIKARAKLPENPFAAIAAEQQAELEAVRARFAKYNLTIPEAALQRGLLLNADRKPETSSALPAPGLALSAHPCPELRDALFGAGTKKAKGKAKGKSKGKKKKGKK